MAYIFIFKLSYVQNVYYHYLQVQHHKLLVAVIHISYIGLLELRIKNKLEIKYEESYERLIALLTRTTTHHKICKTYLELITGLKPKVSTISYQKLLIID